LAKQQLCQSVTADATYVAIRIDYDLEASKKPRLELSIDGATFEKMKNVVLRDGVIHFDDGMDWFDARLYLGTPTAKLDFVGDGGSFEETYVCSDV
jgi:hypothetical protein